MERFEERACRYALNALMGFRPVAAWALLEEFGSAAGIFESAATEEGKARPDLELFTPEQYRKACETLARIEDTGSRFVSADDEDFPALLRECPDCPVGLFVRCSSPIGKVFGSGGNLSGYGDGRKFIGIVGTRDLSSYGKEWCEHIVDAIASSGNDVTIVSGLAIGTDITAHLRAMQKGIPTIAVLPTGIDTVYPARHSRWAGQMSRMEGGAVVTDYPPGTPAVPHTFVRRNRIIAGLCHSLILIESKIRGGGLITAQMSFSYNREVFALPGRIDDVRSEGCNRLVKRRIAEPIISMELLLESLGLGGSPTLWPEDQRSGEARAIAFLEEEFSSSLSGEEIAAAASVLRVIRENRDIPLEELALRCGMEYRKVAELVYLLENKGLVRVDMAQRCSYCKAPVF